MVRWLGLVGLVVLGLVAVLGVHQFLEQRQAAQLDEVKARVIARDPPLLTPMHDNGFQCLGAMLDVAPPAVSPSAAAAPEQTRALAAWAEELRRCGNSAKLTLVEGLLPWEATSRRWQQWQRVMPALIDTSASDVSVLLSQKMPEVAAARCGGTLALSLDQSHLGSRGLKLAEYAVKTLASPCRAALKAVPPEAQPAAKAEWVQLMNRLIDSATLERLCRLEKTDAAATQQSRRAVFDQLTELTREL